MAVRSFDLTETTESHLTIVEPAPCQRRDRRRSRSHWMVLGATALAVPFVLAVVTIGVVH